MSIENELAMSHAEVSEIINEIIFEDGFADAVAALYVAGRTAHAGRVLTDRIEAHLITDAARQQRQQDAKDRDDKAAEIAAERVWGRA